jgi:hypothetical protein
VRLVCSVGSGADAGCGAGHVSKGLVVLGLVVCEGHARQCAVRIGWWHRLWWPAGDHVIAALPPLADQWHWKWCGAGWAVRMAPSTP